jgi:hypothetical protein
VFTLIKVSFGTVIRFDTVYEDKICMSIGEEERLFE